MFGLRLAAVAMAVVAATGAFVAPASAGTVRTVTETITYTPSCGAGTFTGYLRIRYRSPYPGRADYIYSIDYRIYRGGTTGENKADIYWYDGGTAPATRYSTRRGRQDDLWHRLGGGYYRGRGATSMRFIFDEYGANDPECSKRTGIVN